MPAGPDQTTAAPAPAEADVSAAAARSAGRAARVAGLATAFLFAAVLINLLSYLVLTFFRHVAVHGTFAGYAFRPAGLWGWMEVFLPLGAVGLAVLCLAIEAWGLGWQRSSARRLLSAETHSTKTDLFYMFLGISGLEQLLAFFFTLGAGMGAGYWLHARIEEQFGYSLLAGTSFPLSLSVVTVVNTFTFYWLHRVMHSRFFWEIHKVHHAAEEMNIVTPHRNHPVDRAVGFVINALPAAVLGASPIVVLTYIVLNGIYQQMVHSDMDWKLDRWGLGWVERYVLISSTAHRIHHSRSREHFDKNFGITPVWDRLFGTYYEPRNEAVRIGLDDEPEHNTGQPVRELWRVYWKGVRTAARELAGLVRRDRSEGRHPQGGRNPEGAPREDTPA